MPKIRMLGLKCPETKVGDEIAKRVKFGDSKCNLTFSYSHGCHVRLTSCTYAITCLIGNLAYNCNLH